MIGTSPEMSACRAARAAFDENQIGIGAVAFEQAFFLGHPQRSLVGAEGGVAHEKFFLRETPVARAINRENDKKQSSSHDSAMNSLASEQADC